MMNSRYSFRRMTAWFMLLIIGINEFSGSISVVRALEYDAKAYEQASEEAEEQIRAAEEAAGIASEDTEEIIDADEIDNEVYEDRVISTSVTLDEDIEVGNLTINYSLNLNGHKIIVHGDVILNGSLYMNDGFLYVLGSVREQYNALISMNSTNDLIRIKGDYIFNSSYNTSRRVDYGTIEIEGNIIGNDSGICKSSIVYNAGCSIILTGSEKQLIDIQSNSKLVIKHLIIKNSSDEGVFSKHILNIDEIEDNGGKLYYAVESDKGGTLTEDTVIYGDYYLIDGSLDLAGHNMTVEGDLIQAGGVITVNGGRLTVKGDYRRQYIYSLNGKEYADYSVGVLQMTSESDYVLIEGDYVDSGLVDTYYYMKAGVMELKGSIKADDTLTHQLLNTGGSHSLKLTGEGKQTIETGKLYTGFFKYANLIIDQPESGSVEWGGSITVFGSVEHVSGNVKGKTVISNAKINGDDLYGDIYVSRTYLFAKDMTIHGNLYVSGSSNYIYVLYDIKVTGNLSATGIHLNIDRPDKTITVLGNMDVSDIELSMSGENGKINVYGDFVVDAKGCDFRKGILEIGGDIKGKEGTYMSCGENAEVIFSGEREQRISITHNDSVFANITVDNPYGVVADDGIKIVNVSMLQGTLSYASGGVRGFSIGEDGEYEGNLVIVDGILDPNGHTYHIKGSLTIAGGTLSMIHADDHIIVDGDFRMESSISHRNKLIKGILEVKGDFYQSGAVDSYVAGKQHTTVFSGNDEQTIAFSDSNSSYFGRVCFKNNRGVVLNNKPMACGEVEQTCSVSGILGLGTGASFVEGKYAGDIIIKKSVSMNQDWNIDGSIETSSSLYVNGHNLIVSDRIYMNNNNSYIVVQHGKVYCGDFAIEGKAGYGLVMSYEDDLIVVYGSLIMNTNLQRFINGRICAGGDVTVNTAGGCAGKNAILELNGTVKQTITMDVNSEKLGHLVINNTSGDGIYVSNELKYSSIDNVSGCTIAFANGGIFGYTLQHDEVINGDLVVAAGDMNLNGHKLTVNGYFWFNGDSFTLSGSTLNVKDYFRYSGNLMTMSDCSVTVGGDFDSGMLMSIDNSIIHISGNWDTYYDYGMLRVNNSIIDIDGGWNIVREISVDNSDIYIAGNIYVQYGQIDLRNGTKLIVDGTKSQEFTSNTGKMYIGDIELRNRAGIYIRWWKNIGFYGDIQTNGNPVGGVMMLYGSITEEYIKAEILYFAEPQKLTHDLYVEGNVDTGYLKLNGKHLVVDGLFCPGSYGKGYSIQSDGIIEIKGDMKIGSNMSAYSFNEGARVILSGTKKQNIESGNLWYFYELEVSNTADEGVYSSQLFRADNIYDAEHKLSFPIDGEMGYTLTKDTVVQGDYTLIIGNLNLNGHKLTVLGDFNQPGGNVTMNGGELYVTGDYIMADKNQYGQYISSKGLCYMNDPSDYICVEGTSVLYPRYGYSDSMKCGIFELKSNISLYISNDFSDNISFVFSGEDVQKVNGYNYCSLGTIVVNNTSYGGVVVMTDMYVNNHVTNSSRLHGTVGKSIYWNNGESPEFDKFEGNLVVKSELVLENDLCIGGTLTVNGPLDINGHHLTAETATFNNSCVVNGGILQIKQNVYFNSAGILCMEQDEDVVQITGNLGGTGRFNLLAGNLDIKGNVNFLYSTVTVKEHHTTTLSSKMTSNGRAHIQTVTMPQTAKFNKLVLTKPRDYYVFSRNVEDMCNELVDDVKDITPPSAPAGLSASDIGYTSLKLSWEPSEDDTDVSGYDIYRNDKKLMSVSGTSYTDKRLTPDTEYSYYVIAKDEVLNTSALSKVLTVKTLADDVAPSVPEELSLSDRCGQTLTMSWTQSSDNVAVAGYRIYRDSEQVGDVKTTSYTDCGLEPNREYSYQILAYDTTGNESEKTEEIIMFTQAVEVSEVQPKAYSVLSGNKAEISAAFVNTGSAKGYNVYMAYKEKGEEATVTLLDRKVGKNTSYRSTITAKADVDTTQIVGEEINVIIRITDAGGYEYEQEYTYYLDKTAPSKLKEVAAEARNGIAVISYEKGREADIAGYHIYRKEAGGEATLIIDSDNPDKTYHYDKTIEPSKEYTYYVAAYDAGGLEGEWSEGAVIVSDEDTEAPRIEEVSPLDGVLTGKVKISVKASDNKALHRLVIEKYHEEADANELITECSIESGTAVYELDTTAMGKEVTLCYTVYDKEGNCNDEFLCTYKIDNEGPSAPTGLSAEIYSTTAVLSWDAPKDEDYSYALVEQILGNGTIQVITRATTTTGCVIEGLTPGETTTYQVTFYDIQGNKGLTSDRLDVTAGADTIVPRITNVTPGGGYYNGSIPLRVSAYDNCAVDSITIEYSTDENMWEPLYIQKYEMPEKQPVLSYDFDTTGLHEGNLYVRVYASDTAGNEGDKEQILIQYIIDHTAPSAVDNLMAEVDTGSIHLKWNEPLDNDVAGYRLYRSVEGLNSYTCINASIGAIGYYDRSAAYDTSYCYQLTAYDNAGNESARSNVVTAQKLPDEKKPVVHSITPIQGSLLAKKVEVSTYVTDNDRVANVEFAIKSKEDGSTKLVIDNISTNIYAGAVKCSFDSAEYANGEYDIIVTAVDGSGNVSKALTSDCVIHNVTLETPVLYGISGDWCVDLHCTIDPSLDYVLYRRNQQTEEDYTAVATGKGSLMYRDTDVNPRYTYMYQVMVQDEAGNTASSALQYVKPGAVDSIAPISVINTNTSVVEGYETIFSGADSTDNDRIVSYRWDFGDGSSEVTGPSPKHTYSKEGEYIVKLTVEDGSGNTDYTTARITVLPKSGAGKAYVTVRNASGSPLKGVTVYVNSTAEKNNLSTTDSKGCTTIMEKPGTYKIALYKPGYMAVEESVEIELHGDKEYVFTLAEGETISADFTVRQMDFDEIVAAGIDLSAPENQHVFTVTTKLSFGDATRTGEAIINTPVLPVKAVVSGGDKGDAGAGSGGGPSSGSGGGGNSKPQQEGDNDEPVPDLYYTIYITQSISWLKDMYEATLIVYNNATSQTIVAKDLTATLYLPAGLSLAITRNGQEQKLSLPDLKGGESGSVSWYVRGDAPGTYKLNAMLNGTLQPFGADFTGSFNSNEFEVTAGKGLVLTICPEDRAEKGEAYYVYYTLSNEGSKEFYNVHTTFGTQHNNSKRYISSSDGTKSVPVMSEGDVVAVECLKPGESISGIYKTSLPVEGDKWYNYKSLVEAQWKACAGSNLGVDVRLSVVGSHVAVPTLVYQEQTEENSEADPVNVSTGAYTDSITALSVQGVNPVLAQLSYDSNATAELGEFGYGWTHNYETRILDMKDGTVRYYVSPTGYYTFLAEDYESKKEIKTDKDGYLYIDVSNIPMKQSFKCLNDNKAGYELKRSDKGAYTLTDKAGNITRFDKKGNVTKMSNREGKSITIERDSNEFTVTDETSGRFLIYELDKDTKLVTSVTDGDRTAYFHYDKNKCLKQFDNALGESTYYTYDKKHRITSVTNDDGITYVENTYVLSEEGRISPTGTEEDAASAMGEAFKEGRVKSQKDALGYVTKFAYSEDDTNGNLTTTVTTRSGAKKKTITDPYGNVVSFTNEAGDTTVTTYDDNGNETYVNQPDVTTADGKKTSYSIS
ncbi:MAG: fibronectin type III domain-containing protein, partial [Lachnospiraceae bacterium]|nr:fibronectin type III domain-containing protein [Lachnospiraceae bacterium]